MSKEELKSEIYQCVGHASMCWTESPRGVFDEKEATIVSEKLMAAALSFSAQKNAELLEILIECEEYFDNKADADHDETGHIPNPEMQMLTKIRSVIEKSKS